MVNFTSTVTLKDHIRETHIFNSRVLVASFIIGLMIIGLITRLAYLQIINRSYYSALSENNRVSILPIPPSRGLVYDRNGVLLAQNLPSFTLEIVPEHTEDMAATLDTLKKLVTISDEDIRQFNKQRKRKRRFEGIPLRFRLSDEEVARLTVQLNQLPGVSINAQLTRHYPQGALGVHAIGYVGRINEKELRKLDASRYSATSHIGKVGIEKAYEDILHGEVGFQHVETNAQGRILNVLKRQLPVSGKNLYLNIDTRLQAVAENSFGEENGALVAIDPRDGAVLALVSVPTYDPNLFVQGLDTKTYNKLSKSHARPLFNRTIRGQYPPGSTIKPLVGLAGLDAEESKTMEGLFCPGWYMLANDERRYRDWKKSGHHHTSLAKAITESCDVYFYDLSLTLGIDRLSKYMAYFGFGKPTGIDIVGEQSGLNPTREWKRRTRQMPWFPGETLITGIGQGFMLSTPVQLAHATATLSMKGQNFQPRMLNAMEDPQTGVITQQPAIPLEAVPIKHERHWQKIIRAMQNVVHGITGTARGISRDLKYKVAGKTGTAQVFGIGQDEEYNEEEIAKKLRDHALFVAFAPVDNPKIAIAVIVENGGSGGAVAAPIVRKVMDAYLLKESVDEPS